MSKAEDQAITRFETVQDMLRHAQEVRLLEEWREKALHDEVTRYEGALEKGKLDGKMEIAQNMLRKGMPGDLVSEITGLSIEQVRKIK